MELGDYMRHQNIAFQNIGQPPKYTEDQIQEYVNATDRLQYPAGQWKLLCANEEGDDNLTRSVLNFIFKIKIIVMMSAYRFFSFVLIVLLAGLSAVQAQRKNSKTPNIIIIFADDMGFGDLSCYGHPTIRTPNLDQMADDGIRLNSFYVAASSCTPSRAALLTGRYPLRSGLPHVIFPEEEKGIPASEITLAEALKEQGYKTMCVGKWHLGQTQKEYMPTSQGFDHYYGLITSNDMMRPWVETDVPLHLYRDLNTTEEFPVDQTTLTARYTKEATNFIKEAKDEPFFLYLPHSMPHVPLYASDRFKGKSHAGLYGDVIEELDWSVGEILKTLEQRNLDKNTIVIFTSDNGPWQNMPDRMFREDMIKPWDAGSTGLFRGAKGTSYEGGFRVPCIVRWPGKIAEKQTSFQVATSMDLYATLIGLAGGKAPTGRILDGVDIMPILSGDTTFRRDKDFYYFQGKQLEAVRSGDWKLRIAPFQGHGNPSNRELQPELYNLKSDPFEQYNRAKEFPKLVSELKEKMLNFKVDGGEIRF
jgi:arylsulfatase A